MRGLDVSIAPPFLIHIVKHRPEDDVGSADAEEVQEMSNVTYTSA